VSTSGVEPSGRLTSDPPASDPGTREGPNVVALGGGHGLATTLQALRRYAGRITAVVSVADDGGSSGRLRRMTGMPAPGDIRRCLVALAEPDSTWSRAFAHRFGAGDLDGHALGNLIIAGLAEVTGDFGQALDMAAELLGVTDRVLPATTVAVALKADIAGAEVLGQVNVQDAAGLISEVSLVPPDAPTSDEVIDALLAADQVVIGPGSLFTSVLATCVVPAIRDALLARDHGRVFVANLRPQVPETAGFTPADLLRVVRSHGVAVDVMIVDEGGPTPVLDPGGPRIVTAALARPDRAAHDPRLLAGVLARLSAEG
jgi:uncharacterized cofD-like protein